MREADSWGLCIGCRRLARDGTGRVRLEATALVVDGELDETELRELLVRLGRMETAIGWWIGDALVEAEKHWRTSWADVLEEPRARRLDRVDLPLDREGRADRAPARGVAVFDVP
jgi:hypothetical protein